RNSLQSSGILRCAAGTGRTTGVAPRPLNTRRFSDRRGPETGGIRRHGETGDVPSGTAWAAGEDRGPFPPATGSTRICGWDGSTTRVGGGRARHPFVILWTARTFRDSAALSAGPAGSRAAAGRLLPAVVGAAALPVLSAGAGGGGMVHLAALAAAARPGITRAPGLCGTAGPGGAPAGMCVPVAVADACVRVAAAGPGEPRSDA